MPHLPCDIREDSILIIRYLHNVGSLGRYAFPIGKYRLFAGVSCLHLQDSAV